MAWNIGANDVANAMGTSVGSGALTLKWAILVAALMEFAGAFLVGSHVTNTVRKGIIDPAIFTSDPNSYIYGMIAALLAAGAWLNIASYKGWPVSTTHAIVGAVLGFGILFSGFGAIHWNKVSQIACQLGGITCFKRGNLFLDIYSFEKDYFLFKNSGRFS
jgi:phosphate/sulfate permease